MESEVITVPLGDGKVSYGLYKKAVKPSENLIIIVPGLTGNYYSYLINHTANRLAATGYDVLAVNLYDWRNNARRQIDTDLAEHATDIGAIIGHFSKQYENIFLAGHSLGGLAIMIANPPHIKAVSLWDPSFAMDRFWTWEHYKKIDDSLVYSDYGFVVSHKMFEQAATYDEEKCLQLSEKFSSPVQVLTANAPKNVAFAKDKHSYDTRNRFNNERVFIDNADHGFTENETTDALIDNVIRWFDGFI